ncbi:PrsW family intramembrane metalloprotease [Corynebacterium gerontici]|uniref:Protease PrsW n=1 Tax=Corynebacterium gerontici TaxID=2079234 RepID=A0A3G6J3E3_9CORY|nr:PrsW family intramembrane metalloprotease [Corynebacterium gerontici]AZA10634.1 hypothetical protein CGERO_01500 [Corynebacterium gerontici]
MTKPQYWTWWLFIFSIAAGTVGLAIAQADYFRPAAKTLLIISPIFIVTTLIFTGLILLTDRSKARRPKLLLWSFIFGATVPTWLSVYANEHLTRIAADLMENGADWGAAFAGPISEEWSKTLGIILIMLLTSTALHRPIHGLLIGAFVGLGFQIFENITYAAIFAIEDPNSDLSGALTVTILRSLIGIASHWLYSAIIGVGVVALFHKKVFSFLGFFALGFGLHFMWNAPVGNAVLKLAVSLIAFVLVLLYVKRRERSLATQ